MFHTASTPGPSAETERRWGDPGDRIRVELGRRASVFIGVQSVLPCERVRARAGERGADGTGREGVGLNGRR